MSSLLQFVVESTLQGRSGEISQAALAYEVFDRDELIFDQKRDPVVRVQAARVRRALERYYHEEGCADPIRIEIPRGTYVPGFRMAVHKEKEKAPSGFPRVAVLPFRALDTDPELEYVANGLTEEIGDALARFRELEVIATYSTRRYLDPATAFEDAIREVNAEYLITGTMRADESIVRVNCQLLHRESHEAVWSSRFEKDLSGRDLMSIRDEIAWAVVSRLADPGGAIERSERLRRPADQERDLRTYDGILKYHRFEMTLLRADFDRSMESLEAGLRRDPGCALAQACLSVLHLDGEVFGYRTLPEALTIGMSLARTAVSVDPECGYAWYSLTYASFVTGDTAGVRRAARRLVELNPGASMLVGAAGWFLCLAGEEEEGLKILRGSFNLNPNYPTWFHLAPYLAHWRREEYAAAFEHARRVHMPGFFWEPLLQAAVLPHLERMDEAHRALDRLLELCPDFRDHARRRVGYLVQDELTRNQILEGLCLAGLDEQGSFPFGSAGGSSPRF